MICTFDEFKKQHTAPTRSVRVPDATFTSLRDSFGLDASATTDDVQAELEKLGKAAKAKEEGHSITTVKRGAPLAVPAVQPAVRKPAKLMRAARGWRASTGPSR